MPFFYRLHTPKATYFDEASYVDFTRLKPGYDAYARHKFNQQASDALPSNREVEDVRFHQLVP